MVDIEKVIAKGDKHRSVANTVMNTKQVGWSQCSAALNGRMFSLHSGIHFSNISLFLLCTIT